VKWGKTREVAITFRGLLWPWWEQFQGVGGDEGMIRIAETENVT
jgi:hypothetical protein